MFVFSHALYLYMMAQLAPTPTFTGPYTTTAPLRKLKTDPIVAVMLVPQETGWLVMAGSRTWAAPAEVSCRDTTRKVIVHREGLSDLVLSLECPAEIKP